MVVYVSQYSVYMCVFLRERENSDRREEIEN